MTFHPILGNHRECALDCGTITDLNERILQLLDCLKDNRLSLAFKRYGFGSGTISIYCFVVFFFLIVSFS